MGEVRPLTAKQAQLLCEDNNLHLEANWSGVTTSTGKPIKYKVRCLTCNTTFWTYFDDHIKVCPYCLHVEKRSQRERQIERWLKKQNIEVVISDRSILSPLEIDIFLPAYNIGLEFNGRVFHCSDSALPIPSEYKPKDYHYFKTLNAMAKGVRLYHFWDFQSDAEVKAIIKNAIKGEDILTTWVDKNPNLVLYSPELQPLYYVENDCPPYHQGLYFQKPMIWDDKKVQIYEIYTAGFLRNNKEN